MPDRFVVCNTSPLLYLHQVNQLDLFPRLYGKVSIPEAVRVELQAGEELGISIPHVDALPWLHVEAAPQRVAWAIVPDLGAGEAEAISLALSALPSLVILDDALGRRIARLNGLTCIGTLGILLKAKQSGALPLVAPVLRRSLSSSRPVICGICQSASTSWIACLAMTLRASRPLLAAWV